MVLSKDQNEALYKAGPARRWASLRRYWMPIAAVGELEQAPDKPVRLLGEDLVLYKDGQGSYGLLDRHCPHRRADMSYGIVEDCGLRCNYHGWLFDETGACLEQPFEEVAHPDAKFKERTVIKSYPVEAKAGLLWAYMGPQPAPAGADLGALHLGQRLRADRLREIPCNWLQCQENSIDPVHFEWLHSNWSLAMKARAAVRPPTCRSASTSSSTASSTAASWRAAPCRTTCGRSGARCLWPNCLFTGDHFEWRVPIDDNTTLSVGWFFNAVPPENRPYEQEVIPYWYSPIKDPETGRWLTTHVMNQDFVAWVGQGQTSDRWNEHLGESDRGVILLRRRLLEEAGKVQRGEEPKALIRDPSQNECVMLPTSGYAQLTAGVPRAKEKPTSDGSGRPWASTTISPSSQVNPKRYSASTSTQWGSNVSRLRLNPV